VDVFIDLLIGKAGLALFDFLLLCGVSFLASFLTAAMGMGGGVLMLATMALILPPTVLIPIHGVVQVGSNLGRAALMLRNILTPIIPAFFIGTALGAAIGAQVVIALPTAILQAVLGCFVIYATWAPKFKASATSRKTFFGVGVLATFATMFVGATGPLVAPFVGAACKERQQVVATHAALMVIQHGLKIITFGFLGFAFGPYLPLLAGLLICGFAGTWCGKHVLLRLPEHIFRIGFKTLLTLLALRLLYSAFIARFG